MRSSIIRGHQLRRFFYFYFHLLQKYIFDLEIYKNIPRAVGIYPPGSGAAEIFLEKNSRRKLRAGSWGPIAQHAARARSSAPATPSSSSPRRASTAPAPRAYGRQHDAAPPSRVNQQHSAARPPPSLCATSNLPHPLCSGGIRQRRVVFLLRRPGQGRALDERIQGRESSSACTRCTPSVLAPLLPRSFSLCRCEPR